MVKPLWKLDKTMMTATALILTVLVINLGFEKCK